MGAGGRSVLKVSGLVEGAYGLRYACLSFPCRLCRLLSLLNLRRFAFSFSFFGTSGRLPGGWFGKRVSAII